MIARLYDSDGMVSSWSSSGGQDVRRADRLSKDVNRSVLGPGSARRYFSNGAKLFNFASP